MKIQIKHFDALNRHATPAIDILKRFYDHEAKKVLIRSSELYCDDLRQASLVMVECMNRLINQAEQESRGFSQEEQQAMDELKRWQGRFQEVWEEKRPSNPLPGETRTWENDAFGNPCRPSRGGGSHLERNAPLTRNQLFSDWCRQYAPSPDIGQVNLGDVVHHWLTGEGSGDTRQSMVSTGTGGVLIPTPLVGQVIDLARNQSRVMEAGAVTYPMDSATLTLPRQVSDPEAKWRGELKHIHRSDVTLEPVVLHACSLGSIVSVSNELLEDAVGLNAFLTRTLSAVMALGIDQAALSGAGAKEDGKRIEPLGVANTPNIQAHSGTLANYTLFSEATTLVRNVNGNPNALIMSPNNFGLLDALADTTGQPLQPPPSWSDYAHLATNQLEDTVAIMGDWTNLAVGVRGQIRLELSRDATLPAQDTLPELHAFSQNATVIRVLWRGDVAVLRPNQFVKLAIGASKARSKVA